jgi:superfamily II DNA or RNA helicase
MIPLAPGQTPRAWQLSATAAARAAFKQGMQAVIVSAATGTGKGTVLAAWARLAAERGGRVLVLVHREELVLDLTARIQAIPGKGSVGVCWASRNEILADIVVASVQSLRSRLDQLTPDRAPRLVITDECHHAPAPTYRAIYARLDELHGVDRDNPPKRWPWHHLGMTATPFRSADGGETTGLGDVYEAVVYEHGIAEAIHAGDLVPVRGLRVETQLDISACRVGKGGDYVEEDLAALVDVEARNALIVDYYEKHGIIGGNKLPALVFAASVAHAQHLADAFAARGHRFAAVWGAMPRRDRAAIVRRYLEGELDGLVSRDLLFEGFDAPRASILLKARPTKSRVVFVQMVGRGLRLFPGKVECLLLDFVDNGCDLDLASVVNLDPGAARKAAAERTFMAGDEVEHRTEPCGRGLVEAVVDGPLYWVLWHESGDRTLHGGADLMRPRAEREEHDTAGARVTRVADYEVLLLPGAKRADAAGWYSYQDVWTVGATSGQGQGPSATGLVRQTGGRWSAWIVSRDVEPARVAVADTREEACAAAEAHLRGAGYTFGRLTATWKGEPATERQIAALRKWRIRRDLTTITRGEASALLDAVTARQRVARAIREGALVPILGPRPDPIRDLSREPDDRF